MQCPFPRLDFFRVQIITKVVSETPTHRDVWVGFFQSEEIFATNPPDFILVYAVGGAEEKTQTAPIKVIGIDILPLATEKGGMRHRTSTAKKVYKI